LKLWLRKKTINGRQLGDVVKKRKTEMYLCGEKFDKEYLPKSDSFYQTILQVFGLKKLREKHSGDISEYLYWIVLGLVFVIILVVLWV